MVYGDPCRQPYSRPAEAGAGPVKGVPTRVFANQAVDALSDVPVDCRGYNAASVQVEVNGVNPSATITVEGAAERGSNYYPLPDPNAAQANVTSARIFDVVVGSAWLKVRLANIVGTFGPNRGYTVTVTPYVSPGQARVDVSVTAEPSGDGTYDASTHQAVVVGTASTQVLAGNANRRYALFVNDSDEPIYLALGVAAVVNDGVRLNSRGGGYEMNAKVGNLFRGAVHAVHGGTGTKRLLASEGV